MATTIKSTALDFNNIKSNLKTFLANKQEFRDYNFEAAGLSNILDVLAYNTHVNALIANFALNESYLGTAQLRSSVVSLAEGIGYVPDTTTASQAVVRIFLTGHDQLKDDKISLPGYTTFTTTVDDVSYTFSTIENYEATNDGNDFYEFKTKDGSNNITLYEGTKRTKSFLVGEYEDNPVYVIPDPNLDSTTVTVKVYDSFTSTNFATYNNVINVTSINANSEIYILKESPNGYFELSFGDGKTFGIAPGAGSRIEVEYLSTKGPSANGAISFTKTEAITFGVTNTFSSAVTTSTVSNSVGGAVKETIESIRKNAPFQYAAQNRMVTAEDYTSLILRRFSTFIKDTNTFGGEDAVPPEYGAVFSSIVFQDDVNAATQAAKKQEIVDLANQLAITSFKIRFEDPIKTFIEADVFFQFNPRLTDVSENNVTTAIRDEVQSYFNLNTGKFKQSFRRSNMLSLVDDINAAVLSSRSNIRMQRRFTPSSPSISNTVKNLTLDAEGSSTISAANITKVVELVVQSRFKDAVNHLINNSTVQSKNFNGILTDLTAAGAIKTQIIRYPVEIAPVSNNEYIITSNQFTYDGKNCFLRNKLNSADIQIVAAIGNAVIIDNVGNFDPTAGIVTINFFNPASIVGGGSEIKLAAIPANQSAISPVRNELLEYDPTRSLVKSVTVTATN
jgi:hypothetical protein